MAVTIKMVAERAGVSVATVSKYINGGNVYDENRIKVQRAIDELDYKVNEVARSLKTSKTYTVGVLAANIQSSFLTTIISKIQTTLLTHGYSTLIADFQEDKALEKKQLEMLMQRHMDGIILFPEDDEKDIVEAIRAKEIPLVLVNNMIMGSRCDAILTDNMEGAYGAVEELIRHGHKRIGIVNGKSTMSTFCERMKGYRRALENYFIDVDERLVIEGKHTFEGGYEGTRRLLEQEEPPTALFVGNYHMTIGALKALGDLNVEIPKDLSVVAFDQLEFGCILKPEISTVIQPQEQIGERAALKILQRMKGDFTDYPQVERLKTVQKFTESIGESG